MGLRDFSRSIMLEIVTGKEDMLHVDPEAARNELLEIHRALLEMKKVQGLKWNQVHNENFNLVNTLAPLVTGNDQANVNPSRMAMMPNEMVVDAFTFHNHWTFKEVLFTILTFGVYWLVAVRFRHGLRVYSCFFVIFSIHSAHL